MQVNSDAVVLVKRLPRCLIARVFNCTLIWPRYAHERASQYLRLINIERINEFVHWRCVPICWDWFKDFRSRSKMVFFFLFREGTRFGDDDLKTSCLRKASAAIKNLWGQRWVTLSHCQTWTKIEVLCLCEKQQLTKQRLALGNIHEFEEVTLHSWMNHGWEASDPYSHQIPPIGTRPLAYIKEDVYWFTSIYFCLFKNWCWIIDVNKTWKEHVSR